MIFTNVYQREKTSLKWKYDQCYTTNIYVNHTVLYTEYHFHIVFIVVVVVAVVREYVLYN